MKHFSSIADRYNMTADRRTGTSSPRAVRTALDGSNGRATHEDAGADHSARRRHSNGRIVVLPPRGARWAGAPEANR